MLEMDDHDHGKCVERILSDAEKLCRQRRVRLTDQRRDVLTTLAESHVPVSAYDILDRLNEKRRAINASPLAPVSVYRALDFLSQQRLIHRIESRNAYVACLHSVEGHNDVIIFLLCESCGRAGEFHSDMLDGLVETLAQTQQFKAHAPVLEIRGLCARCQGLESDDDQKEKM